MSKTYDQIATVDIDVAANSIATVAINIESPMVDNTSFDNLLIMGPAPKGENNAPDVGVFSSIDKVEDAGFITSGPDADPIGVAARVAFSQSPAPTKVYIAIQKSIENGAVNSGEETVNQTENELESPVTTIARALEVSGWYVLCTAGVDPSEYKSIAAYIETQEKIFCYTEMGFFGAGEDGENEPTVGKVYYRTCGIYGRETTDQSDEDVPEVNWYMNVAWIAKWLNYESGSETSAFKTLASVYPSALNSTEMKALADANLNYFITVGNKNISMNGKVIAGEWADIIRFRDWLKNDMQVRVVNLFVTSPKVPYTDSGIALVQNQMIASLKYGQDVGGIAEDEFDEDGETIPGYTTSVPLVTSLSASEKASRRLTKCKFKARLAGAIHFAEITGSLAYEL